ncbi:MAG TPA: histidine kinase [Actinomycetales bacterium]|nr:histidine kinase [Actinomycetales bacterium]
MTTIVQPQLHALPANAAAHALRRPRPNGHFRLTLLLILGSVLGIGALEAAAFQTHPMISHTLSELFYAPRGRVLFPAAALLLAGAITGWARMLLRGQMRIAGFVAVAGGVGLIVAAIFPTDPSATDVLSWSAQVHRYAAAAMFIAVPIAGLAHLRTARLRPSHRAIIIGSVVLSALAAFPAIAGRLESLVSAGVWNELLQAFAAACGLVERIQLLLAIAIIATSTHALSTKSAKLWRSPSISNNKKVTMSTERSPRRSAGHAALFGYSWLLIFLAIPAWLLIGFFIGSTVLALVWVGVGLWGILLAPLEYLTGAFRNIAQHILGIQISASYRSAGPDAGMPATLRVRLTDPARWRDVAYLFFAITVGFVIGIATVIAFFIFPIGYWLSPWLLRTWADMTRVIIGPGDTEELKERIGKLERSRSETVDHSAAELRRIERDLHDGAQARLVSVAIELGLAENALQDNPKIAAQLVTSARESTQTALAEIRDLVRGIHPPVLADRGLSGGIEALALAAPGRVEVEENLVERFPAPVESAAYFAVAEALANSTKHARARKTTVAALYRAGTLTITITDDGTGGAYFAPGGGLEGMKNRLDAFDGTVDLRSPTGGPTEIVLRVPTQPADAEKPVSD